MPRRPYHVSLMIIVIGTLLPSLGPLLGLNIAAIQPTHSHLFFGTDHQHHHDLFLETILPHPHPAAVDPDPVVSTPTVDILNSVYSLYLLFFSAAVLFGFEAIFSCRLKHEKGFVSLVAFSPPYPPPR